MSRNVSGLLKQLGFVDLTEAVTRFSAKGPVEAMPLDRMPKPITEFLDYWKLKCGDSDFPEHTAIDPIDIPRLLPNLMLWTPLSLRQWVEGRILTRNYERMPVSDRIPTNHRLGSLQIQ